MPELGVTRPLEELGRHPTADSAAALLHEEHPAQAVVLRSQPVDQHPCQRHVVVTAGLGDRRVRNTDARVLAVAHEADLRRASACE